MLAYYVVTTRTSIVFIKRKRGAENLFYLNRS